MLAWDSAPGHSTLLAAIAIFDQSPKAATTGLVGSIIVGIVGGLIAGWLLSRTGVVIGGGVTGAIINAFIGAVILLVCACVIAWQFWNAPSGEVRLLRRLQARRCAQTGERLWKSAE